MSHYAKNRIEGLNNEQISWPLVEKAVDLLEKEGVLSFQRVSTIDGYGNRKDRVQGIGLRMAGDRYGIDLFMDNDTLVVGGESMGDAVRPNSHFMKEFTKAYSAMAIQESLYQNEGFYTTIKTELFGSGNQRVAQYELNSQGF